MTKSLKFEVQKMGEICHHFFREQDSRDHRSHDWRVTTINDYLTSKWRFRTTRKQGGRVKFEKVLRETRAPWIFNTGHYVTSVQRIIHFGAVSNNFATFCINNKTVATPRRPRRFMVHFCRVLRRNVPVGSSFFFKPGIKYAKYISANTPHGACNKRLIDIHYR